MRDRAFDRIIVIPIMEQERLNSIIGNIPRENVVKSYRQSSGYAYYIAKVKKEELLAIKLSIRQVSITKVKVNKNRLGPLEFLR